jgi:NAD(P)H-hydrate epimerase
MKIATVEQMRSMDRHAIETLGIPEMILMENAGLAAVAVLDRETGIAGKRFTVLCGIGNNGGDGFVVARVIHSRGGRVKVFALGDTGKLQGAARTHFQILGKLPVPVTRVEALQDIRRDVLHADRIVDALFGTGLDREIVGLYREVIQFLNESGRPVLSLDIPSGINGDNGAVMGIAVRADCTVTFGLPKVGNLLYPGHAYGGRLYVSHISFPPALTAGEALHAEINAPLALPPRAPDGHKGSFGEALFIAGAKNYYGAPYFAALSFLKAGGGYARLAAPAAITPFIAQKGSEIVFLPQAETAAGSLALENKAVLLETAARMDFTVIGPGVSLAEETQALVRELAGAIETPLLIDGDGLTALVGHPEILRGRKAPTILTPHLGEMSRITGKSADELRRDRLGCLRDAARDLAATIVLKGAHSLIGTPEGRVFVNLTGNAGMATAGAGDVLTGAIAAMHGLGLAVTEAVRQGVYLHGLAGDLAAAEIGVDGLTAQDILEALPRALKAERDAGGASPGADGKITVI